MMKRIVQSDGWDDDARRRKNKDKFVLWGYVYGKTYNPPLIGILNDLLEVVEDLERRLESLESQIEKCDGFKER